MSSHLPAWTHEQCIEFESATEVLADCIGMLKQEISKAPDSALRDRLNVYLESALNDKNSFRVTDDLRVKAINEKYGSLYRTLMTRDFTHF